jgi:hypothetical protein
METVSEGRGSGASERDREEDVKLKYCAMNATIEEVDEGSDEWKRLREMIEEESHMRRDKGLEKIQVGKQWTLKEPGLLVTNLYR